MKALQTFARLGGRIRRGEVFETNAEHAAYLAASGLAVRLDQPGATQAAAPSEAPAGPVPSEVNDEIKAVGGGWFEWRGKRYRGRAAADAAKEQEG